MRALSMLSPAEFENLIYDLSCLQGLKNAVWRTPGADGGRDIEGTISTADFSGFITVQRLYIECKRYTYSIDWPTIYSKLAYAHMQEPDFLLIATNNNPTPSCENNIGLWNNKKIRPQLRIWRGYEIEQMLDVYSQIRVKYDLFGKDIDKATYKLNILLVELSKIVQSAYSQQYFGTNPAANLEAGVTLSELVSEKTAQLNVDGKISLGYESVKPPEFAWANWTGWEEGWSETALRAILALYRYFTSCEEVSVAQNGIHAQISALNPKYELTSTSIEVLKEVAFWGFMEIRFEESGISLSSTSRPPTDGEINGGL